jgi:hypothetical protein
MSSNTRSFGSIPMYFTAGFAADASRTAASIGPAPAIRSSGIPGLLHASSSTSIPFSGLNLPAKQKYVRGLWRTPGSGDPLGLTAIRFAGNPAWTYLARINSVVTMNISTMPQLEAASLCAATALIFTRPFVTLPSTHRCHTPGHANVLCRQSSHGFPSRQRKSEIHNAPAAEIVIDHHVASGIYQPVAEVRANHSRSTRNECTRAL